MTEATFVPRPGRRVLALTGQGTADDGGTLRPRILPVTVQIGRMRSSRRTRRRTVAAPPNRYVIGSAPVHSRGAGGPPIDSRITCASAYDSGALMIFGSDTASLRSMRFAPGSEAHPGVSGSPGTMKSYTVPPRWM